VLNKELAICTHRQIL